MYTIEDEKDDIYDDNEYVASGWDNNKGLIFKIIIIILCIIVLIWLIKALNNNKYVDNGSVHAANVEKVRLAAENYFFINNNKDNTSEVTLAGLKNSGLIGDVIDANSKACNDNNTKVNLKSDIDSYEMKVNLSCSTNDKEETFYYHKNTLACLNCNGKTNMDGKTVVINDDKEKKEDKKEEEKDEVVIIDDKEDEYNNYYSCIKWSDWSTNRVFDASLDERSKTLVQGVKYGQKTIYSDWSEYTTTPIYNSDTQEVETKTEQETVWSGNKTATSIDTTNANIKVISQETAYESSNGCNGFVENGSCYSNNKTIGNLTMTEYTSGNYKILNDRCERVQTLLNSEGRYVLTYVNCEYYKKISNGGSYSRPYTIYTYQELETKEVVYYRYRTVNTINEPDVYTNEKYEEAYLPEGYVKVDGSEETYYSYKLNTCEK